MKVSTSSRKIFHSGSTIAARVSSFVARKQKQDGECDRKSCLTLIRNLRIRQGANYDLTQREERPYIQPELSRLQ